MSRVYVFLIFITTLSHAYIVEIETKSKNKACVEDLYQAGEPISIQATIHLDQPVTTYFISIVIETADGIRLEYKRFESSEKRLLLVHNSEIQQTLQICVENFEDNDLYIELDIKSKSLLVVDEQAPNFEDYMIIDEKSNAILLEMEKSKNYMEQSDKLINEILKKGLSFGDRSFVFSMMVLCTIVVVSLIQIKLTTKELQKKKLF